MFTVHFIAMQIHHLAASLLSSKMTLYNKPLGTG
jgi:hypothetical protein